MPSLWLSVEGPWLLLVPQRVPHASPPLLPPSVHECLGQFGVGFYSAFMVGDSVEVTSRSYSLEEPGHTWKSTGSGSYEIGPVEGEAEERG